jgi:hypothetical protein
LGLKLFRVQKELRLIVRGRESQRFLAEDNDAFVGDGFQAVESGR